MSINNQQKKLNKNMKNISNNGMNSVSTNQQDNKQYNVIINQNSTFNQDNSINIMLDGTFPYFQNYNNYQPNETEPNKNQMYPLYLEKQSIQEKSERKKSEIKEESKEKMRTPKHKSKKKHQYSPKHRQKKGNEEQNQNSTNKIDYRYVKKRPIKDMITPYKNDAKPIDKDNQFFWFATYDKLMKTKYLLKIFNYYNNKPFESQHNLNYNFKEKTLVVKDFEIYFYENSNKPFIRYNKGSTIYTKLYLLTLKQINQIFSYLNRIEYKIDYDRLNYLQRKGTFELINDNTNEVILPYCLIYCLGKYMNINIYAFSNNIDFNIYLDETCFQKSQRISSYTVLNNDNNNMRHNYILSNDKRNNKMDNTNINRENFKLPNSKKIAKLIKIINLNFPDFSIDDIINYLIPDNKYLNAITKISEIKNIFFFKKSTNNKIFLSSMVRDTIKGISIQTPKSLISSFCPAESIIDNHSYKNSDLFLPASKKYVMPIKDDYKFQTISTNEKDNNKNNPFIIYVCDNVQKINFTNDNQTNPINNNNNTNINNINNNATSNNINPQNNNNKSIEINTNYIDTNNNNYLNTVNINNTEKEKSNKKLVEKNVTNKKSNEKIKVKHIKVNYELNSNSKNTTKNNNIISSGNKKGIKIKRISSDINTLYKPKYKSLSGVANLKNEPRESYKITRSNLPLNNLNNAVKQLNKSIEGKNLGQYRLSKNSDRNAKKKQQKNSNVNNINNKTKIINRVNLHKKENPFFNGNINNKTYNTNI